jgi:hypothetical protein
VKETVEANQSILSQASMFSWHDSFERPQMIYLVWHCVYILRPSLTAREACIHHRKTRYYGLRGRTSRTALVRCAPAAVKCWLRNNEWTPHRVVKDHTLHDQSVRYRTSGGSDFLSVASDEMSEGLLL